MEETTVKNTKNCTPLIGKPPPTTLLELSNHHGFHNGFSYQERYQPYPPLLPLPLSLPLPLPLPPLLLLPPWPATPPLLQRKNPNSKTHTQKPTWKQKPVGTKGLGMEMGPSLRPDSGGAEGPRIPLLANHFLVRFDPSQRIIHYDINIYPRPSKETARMIKKKLVEDNPLLLSSALPVFDGRKNLYSPIEFQANKLELYVSLPIPAKLLEKQKAKLFRVTIRLVSKLSINEDCGVPLPQDYVQALDVVLRESLTESCNPIGRSFYPSSAGGGIGNGSGNGKGKDIGGGAVGMQGFFQSLRQTQQGLALNVDSSVATFHESIGIIDYLQKRCDSLRDLSQRKTKTLVGEERMEVERALKNLRVFVSHRETEQRYRVFSLTDEATEKLKFRDRDGRELMVVDYFKDQYSLDIEFKDLPCLQIGRSKPCYLPMELCVVCEGQKFLGKLSDDQTARMFKMGCQRPLERKEFINGVVGGAIGPTSGIYASEFNLQVSKEMTQLYGRVLPPPKLKLGDGGLVKELTPYRHDRQWNLLDSHVAEGSPIKKWALISFGGTPEQHYGIPKFTRELANRCEQLGMGFSKSAVVTPVFVQFQVLNNVVALESKLRRIHEAASGNLQLLICVMEKKHRGYADLKRIAETRIGVMSQCCLYTNLTKLGSQFLANLALKINAKLGGCNVLLYNSLPCQIPRIFSDGEPAIFMGADVTHPHPLDDFSPSVAAVVGSMNWPAANNYISRMRAQTHRQEIIENLEEMAAELLEDFKAAVKKLPSRIIFFRDGVSETQFSRVLKEELQAIRASCLKFPDYKPTITFVVVQKRHHTRLFLNDKNPACARFANENIPPGTVVDTVVTHPSEFDFYLCSHWGMKGTSRPTHYHVLWDENKFKSDELQKLIHSLCYTFVKCTKPVSLVPPAYYAHLAAYRGRLYLDRPDSVAFTRKTLSRAGPPQTVPLPKLRDNVKKLMFYC